MAFKYSRTYNRLKDNKKIVIYKDYDVCSETFEDLRYEVYEKIGRFYHLVNWGKTYGEYKTVTEVELLSKLNNDGYKLDLFCYKPYKIEYDEDDLYVFI